MITVGKAWQFGSRFQHCGSASSPLVNDSLNVRNCYNTRMKLCLLYLTCADDKEADRITQALLEKKLVFCVKKYPVFSSFLWKGKVDSAREVLLIMDSLENNFEKVHMEVSKIHSYDTFVLVSTPVSQATEDVKKWFKEELVR